MSGVLQRKIWMLVSLLLCSLWMHAQLCTGSLGDPVVNITFGAGPNPGPQLKTTSYKYHAVDCPDDGFYAVRNATSDCFDKAWHNLVKDHTGDPNGYFMLVNGSYQPGDFYVERINGLCGQTTYEFSAWLMNVMLPGKCAGNPIRPNITFLIETVTGTTLATFNSGDIPETATPVWKQYGFFFTTPAGINDVVIRMRNNAEGGCGNDLAIDDITFRPCGATVAAGVEGSGNDVLNLCTYETGVYRFEAIVSDGYNDPELQWQQSSDGGQTWQHISGANKPTLEWTYNGGGSMQFRVLVAERGNINSPACRVASKPIRAEVRRLPEIPELVGTTACEGQPLLIEEKTNPADWENTSLDWITPLPPGFVVSSEMQGNELAFQLYKPRVNRSEGGTYTYKIFNSYGCVSTGAIQLNIDPRPNVVIVGSDNVCEGSSVALKSNASVAAGSITKYSWTLGNGAEASGLEVSPLFAQTGQYEVQHWANSDKGCNSDTLVKTIVVHPVPEVSFQSPQICLSDAWAQFTNTTTIANDAPLIYRWSFDPQRPDAVSTEKDGRHRYTAAGLYDVKLEATSAAGCKAETTQTFTLNGSQPKAAFTLNNAALICSAEPVVLRNQSTVDFGSISKLVIYWRGMHNSSTVTIDENPQPDKEYSFDYSPFMTAAEQTFTILLQAYSGGSCYAESVKEIKISRSPQLTFAPVEPVCLNVAPFALTQAREQNGLTGYGIYVGEGISSGSTIFNPATAGVGSHRIVYQFTSTQGCVAEIAQNISVNPLPVVDAGPDQTIVAGGTVKLEGTATGQGLSFNWTPAADLSDPHILTPMASPVLDRIYQVRATTPDGCSATDKVVVKVMSQFYIPNAFTPNGDGVNDTWHVPFLQSVPGAEVRVYNRYGEQVFQGKGTSVRWDGRFGGKMLPSGAYVYVLDLKNGTVLKGTIMLMR